MLSPKQPALNLARTLVFTSLALALASAEAAPAYQVTSGNDIGAGSLREALQSGASNIVILPQVSAIGIHSTLEYTGTGSDIRRCAGVV